MIGVFVGGPYSGQAREMPDQPPEYVEFTSTSQDRVGGLLTRHYQQVKLLDQPGGESFAIYRLPEEASGAPSSFEEIVDESLGRWGNVITVDAADLQELRIVVGGRRRRFTIAHELGHWICQSLEGELRPVYCRAAEIGVDPEARALELAIAWSVTRPRRTFRGYWSVVAVQVNGSGFSLSVAR